MRVLVTGANGFLGGWLCRALVQRGDTARALVRSGSDVTALDGLAIEHAVGDVTDAKSLERAMDQVEVVFHLAGVRRAPERETFFKVNAEGTRRVCQAMLASGTARRLVLCGSLSASGPSRPGQPLREEDPFRPEEWYGESKAEAERIALSFLGRLEVAVARPARILGPGDRENLAFFKVVRRGLRLKIGGGPRLLSMVDVEDVVDLLVLLAERKEAIGEAFFCASPETTTLEALQDQVASSLGIRVRTLYLPTPLLRGLGNLADVASRMTGRHLPLNRKLARQLLAPGWTCSSAKAERLLGYRPRRSLADSINRSAAWYQARGLI